MYLQDVVSSNKIKRGLEKFSMKMQLKIISKFYGKAVIN